MYKIDWNSAHPGHLVFLLDLSESMGTKNRIDDAINALQITLTDIYTQCLKSIEDPNGRPSIEIRERVSVSIYGYNSKVKNLRGIKNWGAKQIGKLLENSEGKPIFDKLTEAKPEWQTCMCAAFQEAKRDIEDWLSQQSGSEIPAPIVINITDGYPYDGKQFDQNEVFERTLRAAKDLMNIRTKDGPVRIMNIQYRDTLQTLRFPMVEPSPTDTLEQKALSFLFNASSVLTSDMAKALNYDFGEAREGARAMVCNEQDPENLTSFISIVSTVQLKPESDVC